MYFWRSHICSYVQCSLSTMVAMGPAFFDCSRQVVILSGWFCTALILTPPSSHMPTGVTVKVEIREQRKIKRTWKALLSFWCQSWSSLNWYTAAQWLLHDMLSTLIHVRTWMCLSTMECKLSEIMLTSYVDYTGQLEWLYSHCKLLDIMAI